MITKIVFNEIIPGLNGSDGLIREHFHSAYKRKDHYALLIMSQTRHQHPGPVRIDYIRYTLVLMDWDNMCASFKHLGDGLKNTKVIKDDKPSIVKKFYPRQVKVKHRKNQKTVIIIEDLAPDADILNPQTELEL